MDKKLFLNNVYGFIRLISLYLHNEKFDIEIDDKTLSFYITCFGGKHDNRRVHRLLQKEWLYQGDA